MSGQTVNRRSMIAGVGAAALSACSPQSKAGPVRLRIGYQKNGVLLLAQAGGRLPGRLSDAGVSGVEWAQFGSGPPMLEAMRAGAIDLGAVGDTPPIFAQAGGSPILYAAAQPVTGAGEGLLVKADSAFHAVADLKGRRIGFTKGSSAHLFVVKALSAAGLSLGDVTPVYLSPADASAAFANGALDGWAIWDPFFAIAEQDGRARVLIDGRAVAPTSSFYIASRGFAARSPAVLNSLLDALAAEAAWGNAHHADAAAAIQVATGLPRNIVDVSLQRELFSVTPVTDAVIRTQQANADVFQRLGVIPAAVDVRAASWTRWTPRPVAA
jgi:sulfonate transport system substrate-binding protein